MHVIACAAWTGAFCLAVAMRIHTVSLPAALHVLQWYELLKHLP